MLSKPGVDARVGFVPSLPQPSAREASKPTPPPGWQTSDWLHPATSTVRHAVRGADVGGGAFVWWQADRAAGGHSQYRGLGGGK